MTITTQSHLHVKNDLILFLGKLNVWYVYRNSLSKRPLKISSNIRIYRNIRVRVVLKSVDPQDYDENLASLRFTKRNKLINTANIKREVHMQISPYY